MCSLRITAVFFIFLATPLSAAEATLVLPPPIWDGHTTVAAFETRESQQLSAASSAIATLTAASAKRTVGNTLAPFDEALRQIDSAAYLAGLMQQVHPDKAFRDAATAQATKASSALSAILLDPKVYHALQALDGGSANQATRYYLQRILLEFKLAGVDKSAAVRQRLKQLNDQLTEQQSTFDRNISDDKRTVTADSREVGGLPPDLLARHKPGADGKLSFSTDYPDSIPVMTFGRDAGLRHRMRVAFQSRAYPANAAVLKSLLATRQEIATLIGYPDWADYNAADKMIRNGHNIQAFIDEVDNSLRDLRARERQMLIAAKRRDVPQASDILDEELAYYEEQVRRTQFDFDSQSVRPYFPYAQLKQGILDTAAELFHVRFEQVPGGPAWAPDVETWLVRSADQGAGGKLLGRFYLDMHPRPGKYSHAATFPLTDGVRGKQLPEGVLVCNFQAPQKDDPALMDYSDAVSFFHEFGHLMHHILGGQQPWAGISGLNQFSLESDFVEAPSQMLEEWIRSPQVLARFAVHYQTHEPIPAALVARMNRATAFGRATWASRQNVFSAISYDIYSREPAQVDFDGITAADMRRYLQIPPTPQTHLWASFTHLGGYSSAYYTYLFDKVIALDMFAQFDQSNLLAGNTPERYRTLVLEPGASMSANDLVSHFLGRPQNTRALQKWAGAEFEPQH